MALETYFPLIATPFRFSATSYVLRVTANSVTENLTFGGSLSATSDYWMVDDGASDSVLTILAQCLLSHSQIGSVTVTLAFGAEIPIVNIETNVACALLWSHASTTVDSVVDLGWTADTSSLSSHQSPQMPEGLWFPRAAPVTDSRDQVSVVGGVSRALSGEIRTVSNAMSKAQRTLTWDWIHKSVALDEYANVTAPKNTFESLQERSMRLGRPVRYYALHGNRDTDDFTAYRFSRLDNTLAQKSPNLVYWTASMDLTKV